MLSGYYTVWPCCSWIIVDIDNGKSPNRQQTINYLNRWLINCQTLLCVTRPWEWDVIIYLCIYHYHALFIILYSFIHLLCLPIPVCHHCSYISAVYQTLTRPVDPAHSAMVLIHLSHTNPLSSDYEDITYYSVNITDSIVLAFNYIMLHYVTAWANPQTALVTRNVFV